MPDAQNDPVDLQAAERFDHLAGQSYINQQMLDAASYYRQALSVRETVLGPNHHEVADSLVRLAGVVSSDGSDNPEAAALWQRAVEIYESIYQEQSSVKGKLFQNVMMSLLGTLGNLAGGAFRQGKIDEAEAGYRRIHQMIEEICGPEVSWLHPSLPTFAQVLIQQDKCDEAERRLRKAIDRTPKVGSSDEWILPDCQMILADLYVKQGRSAEAEPLYQQAAAKFNDCDPGL